MSHVAPRRTPDREAAIDPVRSNYRELRGPEPLGPLLSVADRDALARIRTRRQLEAAPLFKARASQIEELTFGLEYGVPARRALEEAPRFVRVVSWNIQHGTALDGIVALFTEHELLAAADVLLLNEVDLGMARSGNRHVSRELGAALGFEHVYGNSYVCLDHGGARDGVQDRPNLHGLSGNAILSRFPIRRAENVSLTVTRDKFESRSEKRLGHKKGLWAEVETPLGPVCFAAAHLDSNAAPANRGRQLDDLLRALAARGGPAVLLGGDLNTTTYDVSSRPRLLWNVFGKMLRGGFPHAVQHYMEPWKLYEKAVFEALDRHGLAWEPFNDLAAGTARYEVGTSESEGKVREQLPQLAVDFLEWRLRPWNGVVPLRVDWFAGRGVCALRDGELEEPGGRTSRSPQVIAKPTWNGVEISDHDPIVVDVVPEGAARS